MISDYSFDYSLVLDIFSKLPCSVYVKDKDGVYTVANILAARLAGVDSVTELVGKTDYDLFSADQADAFRQNDIAVMKTGKSYSVEEISFLPSGDKLVQLSTKKPLMDETGTIDSVLGVTVDITDRKKAEELEVENKLQREFRAIAEQVAHDIRSPLVALSMLAKGCQSLSEKEYTALRNVVANIENIASNLLEKRMANPHEASPEYLEYLLVYSSLHSIFYSKMYQYKKTNAVFNYSHDFSDDFVFIRGNFSDFCRMLSNLLDNSFEALEGKKGVVDLGFFIANHTVKVFVKDNGKGMPPEMVRDIMQDIPVASTKPGGYGIGLQQIKATLRAMNAGLEIESEPGVGTKILLTFQEVGPPSWFASEIVLDKDDILVVVDNDPAVQSVLMNRVGGSAKHVVVKCFNYGLEAVGYINSLPDKKKVLLLTDHELRNQSINGLGVIEQCGLEDRAVVMTREYTYIEEIAANRQGGLKMFPKTHINSIPIIYLGQNSLDFFPNKDISRNL
ncbi:MAG: PAS domain-containing protein [Holosporaceae bacterium]|jgi:PAS domain S-box-containing protein|nr:PAS domain-containing protein [Holosporaceae bacterium]